MVSKDVFRVDALKGKSFFDYIDPDSYDSIKKEVGDFLDGLMEDSQKDVEVVIAVDRKGKRIMTSFVKQRLVTQVPLVVSDNEVMSRHVKDKRVLIFDDSIHTGNSIITRIEMARKLGPKSISVGCLLVNRAAIDRIGRTAPDVDVYSCVEPFSDYSKQGGKWLTWETTFSDGLDVKDNPDSPSLVMRVSADGVDHVSKSLIESLRGILVIDSSSQIDATVVTLNMSNLTFDLVSTGFPIPSPYDSIAVHDYPKLRCVVTKTNEISEIMFMPLINPRSETDKCEIWSSSPENCIAKIAGVDKFEDMCKACVPFFVNSAFLTDLQNRLPEQLEKRRIKVLGQPERKNPAFGRFLH